MLVVAVGVTQAPNDKEQVEPMLATLKAQAEVLGAVECLIADAGYCSEKNIKACGGRHRAADRGGSRRAPSELAGAPQRASATARECHPCRPCPIA
jgi:hypothetical protein